MDWEALKRFWAARHAHVHNDGQVDERYLRAVPSSPLKAGQRVLVSTRDALAAIELAEALCGALAEKDDR